LPSSLFGRSWCGTEFLLPDLPNPIGLGLVELTKHGVQGGVGYAFLLQFITDSGGTESGPSNTGHRLCESRIGQEALGLKLG